MIDEPSCHRITEAWPLMGLQRAQNRTERAFMPDKTDGTASQAGGEEGGAEEERRGDGEKKGTLAKEVTGAGRTRRLSGKGMTEPCSSSLGTHRCPSGARVPWPHAALRLSPSSRHGVDLGLRGEPVTTLLESSSSDREANEGPHVRRKARNSQKVMEKKVCC